MVYVAIAANTEASLDAVARQYRDKYPNYAKVGFDDTRAYFRHEFGDFGFFAHGHDMSAYDACLEKADNLLSQFVQETDELLDYWLERLNEDFDAAWEYVGPLHERILDTCERVMRRLDNDKVFELNSKRDNVTILVRHGDSEADPEVARRLNPDSVYMRFLNDEEIAQKAGKIIHSN